MADPAYNVVLRAGEATPTNVVLRVRPSPLVAAALVVVTLFTGEASPTTVRLRDAAPPSGPAWEAPLSVSMDDAGRNSYQSADGKKLLLGTHDTAPELAWIFANLPAPSLPAYPFGVDEIRNSYRPPDRRGFILGTDDTAPYQGWLRPPAVYPPISDEIRNSYRPPGRRGFILGTDDTVPYQGWLRPPAVYPPISDETRNSWRAADQPRFVLGTHDTAPELAWIFKAIPAAPPPTYPPDNDASRNSYSPPRRAVFRLGVHDLVPEAAWITTNVTLIKVHVWLFPEPRQTIFASLPRPGVVLEARLTDLVLELRPLPVTLSTRSTTIVLQGGYDEYVSS